MRVAALHGLDQLVDDVRRRRAVGVAHAEVDDVLAAPAGGHLELGGDVEDVRRQALDARELRLGDGGHGISRVSARNRPSDVRSGASYNRSEFTRFTAMHNHCDIARAGMKFHLQTPAANVVTGCGPGWVRVGVRRSTARTSC